MKTSVSRRLGKNVGSLLSPGRIELVLSGLMILFMLVIGSQLQGPLANAIDILAYLLAALTARWPKTGATLVALFLLVRSFLPHDMGSMSEYTAMIVVLGLGMRGEVVLRRVMAVIYWVTLIWFTRMFAPSPVALVQGAIIWGTLIGVVWVVGSASYGYSTALRRAHAAEAQLQRQVLARELHDTVARSFTKVAMVAERARLRGGATTDDLDLISDAATKGVDELRLVMGLLRDPSASVEALSGKTSLAEALAEAQRSLRADGFNAAVIVEGDLATLDETQSATLAAVTAEAAANIARHGDPDQPTGIVVQVEDGRAELAFVNTVASDDNYSSAQPMGLWGMRQRIESAGGSVEAGTEDQHWVVRVGLPLTGKAEAS